MTDLGVLIFLPLQQAKNKEKRIDAALFLACFRSAKNLGKMVIELIFHTAFIALTLWKVDNNFIISESIFGKG
ncbi:hypothetical protein GALL_478770 [mine drainage metagenome]|uniref:Uncharacterized protein n=1 Tax=mine drainage metagenome TaxID=410659 RepID=A0A1J5Q3R1_9ZZZZ